MLNREVINAIESFASPTLQEPWDNTGLQVGSAGEECRGVLICFDVTPEAVDEAIAHDCNLIVSHHPLFFKGVKRLTGATPQEAAAINAVTAGISIYSSHTASDSTSDGVSYMLSKKLGVTAKRVLQPLTGRYVRLDVMVPESHAEDVRGALFAAGAGDIDGYDSCSFNLQGYGTFRAKAGASPYVGKIGETHLEKETMVSVMLPSHQRQRVENALLEAHPYEVPAYQLMEVLNTTRHQGLGIYGTLETGMKPRDFVKHVKEALGAEMLRTSELPGEDVLISRVAVCGGAGGELIGAALSMGAQAYITADIRYHDFVDHQHDILLIDAGHYETEIAFKAKIYEELLKAVGENIKVRLSKESNPVHYY